MKNILLKKILKYKFSRNCIYFIIKFKNFKVNSSLIAESLDRKKYSLFQYENLSKNIPVGFFHPNGDIQLYGFYHVLLKYVNKKSLSYNVANEHGFIFSSFVHKHFNYHNTIITFSDYRENYINKEYPLKKSLKVGPYIHYAESLLNQSDFIVLKSTIGKTLLVFPFHSIDGVISDFDSSEFVSIIEEQSKGYDTVIVCLYFKDIQLGRAKEYIDKGYKVTTAGHINDAFFLNRLKSIIELSDSIISNEVGSYLAYGFYLKKTIKLVRQKTSFSDEELQGNNDNGSAMIDIKKHFGEYYLLQDRLFEIFNGSSLSHSDYEYTSNLFGINNIKTPRELLSYLK